MTRRTQVPQYMILLIQLQQFVQTSVKVIDALVEYQQRGSPHVHMMLWLENAPVFGIDKYEDVISFIDQIITCETPKDNADLLDLVNQQTHRHSHTYRMKSKSICRFNYPQPPMRTTQILYPLDDSFSGTIVRKLRESFKSIKKILNDLKEGKYITFDQLFINLEWYD